MNSTIFLLICENLKEEIETALMLEGIKNVEIKSYICLEELKNDHHDLDKLLSAYKNQDNYVILLSSKCIGELTLKSNLLKKKDNIIILDSCTELFLPDTLLKSYIDKDYFILTAGQLKNSFKRLKRNQDCCKKIAKLPAADIKKILLLNTNIDKKINKKVADFSSYFNLPYEVLPIGLEYLRLKLNHIINTSRVKKERENTIKEIADMNRISANYEMAFDLVKKLTLPKNENEVFNDIYQIFYSLFLPKKIIFVTFEGNKTKMRITKPANLKLDKEFIKFREMDKIYELLTDENGFIIKIEYKNKTLGILKLEEIEFSQYLNRYLNIALIISRISGLALANARVYQRLNHTLDKLKESNDELERFASIVSHDLKQPLSTIIGYMSVLEKVIKDDVKIPKSPEELIEKCLSGALYMDTMITSLLKYARLDKVDNQFKEVDMNEVILEVKENLRSAINESNSTIIKNDLPVIQAIELQMLQLFQNLIDNAIKFRGENPPKIIISAEDQGDQWKFSVADNGMGIDKINYLEIFKPFFRIDKKNKSTGSGIGLSICKKIIDIHKGEIWLESEIGKGTTFYLIIPKNANK
ncbi:MAG: hypothetical protein GF317_22130 [Candidatus Lokiarchaeota archaeon]|nr:hypothetical protein [Candidatus Lokiarchaeota archaeon]MBD3202159.1 hypothetical protein [Candidatus Lokiarchaeota archaeon]